MRLLRLSVTVIFVIVSIVFVGFYVNEKINTDNTIPKITIENELLDVDFNADTDDFLRGVTAFDGKDGDITDKIIVESISKFVADGICKVKYAVCDSNNNVATATRKIRYKNYYSPSFTMKKSTCYSIYEVVNTEDTFFAEDCIDGDISRNIIVTSKDFTDSVAGVFEIEVSVTNSKGDTSVIYIPLIVEDRAVSAPKIELKEYLVYTQVGKPITFEGLIDNATDKFGNDLTSNVRIEENVDFMNAGTYSVHFYVIDGQNVQGHTVLNVIVG